MKHSVIAIQSFVITTIVYALLAPIFFEMENVFVKGEYSTDDDKNIKATIYNQQVLVETECKSPCPSSAAICIEMCA